MNLMDGNFKGDGTEMNETQDERVGESVEEQVTQPTDFETANAAVPEEQIPQDAEEDTGQNVLNTEKNAEQIPQDAEEDREPFIDLFIELQFEKKVSYVMYHNKMNIINVASAVNKGDPLKDVVFRLSSVPSFFKPVESRYDLIQPGQTVFLLQDPSFSVMLDPAHISEVTEKEVCTITLDVFSESNKIHERTFLVDVLPFNFWPGANMPETIACFVMPNSSCMSMMRSEASAILKSWDASPSLDGYQSEDRDTVKRQAAAVYAAMEKRNIIYVNPPANFESSGQRVRTPEEVIANREGTCIDLAVTYASILESIGINPLVFIIKGHAFAGFWLVDNYQNDIVNLDNAAVTRHIRNRELLAVECTALVSGAGADFEEACRSAAGKLEDAERFICSVDIKRARRTISPMPSRRLVDGLWVVEREDVKPVSNGISPVGMVYEDMSARKLTKVDIWKRDLLDITSRNNMVNMKMGTKVTPLLITDTAFLEDVISEGKELKVQSRPLDWNGSEQFGGKPFESENYICNYREGSVSDAAKGILRIPMNDNDTQRTMRSIYRQATKEIEESGCNSFFITLGVLRWYEGKSTGAPHYAPLILIPATIRKVRGGFAVSKSDEDTVFNVTLLEKLRQEFEIDIPMEDPLPTDEKGVNVDRIFQIVRRYISTKDGWEVFSGASMGVFSFSQFAMWKDLDTNLERLSQSKIVRSLIDGTVLPGDNVIDDSCEPYGLCLTVPADGSQIRAVRASGRGESFVMHGPPGTGKSQTITNIITNCLYEGKTVLFVAEKREALVVVQKRLNEVGIGNHCLELHSNKTSKSQVLDHIKHAMERCQACEGTEALVKQIEALREKLDAYASDLHEPLPCGISMYDCISRYESYNADGTYDITVDSKAVSGYRYEDIEGLEQMLHEAVRVYRFVMDHDTDEMRMILMDRPAASLRQEAEDKLNTLVEASENLKEVQDRISVLHAPFDTNDCDLVNTFVSVFKQPSSVLLSEPDLNILSAKLSDVRNRLTNFRDALYRLPPHASLLNDASVEALRSATAGMSSVGQDLAAWGIFPPETSVDGTLATVGEFTSVYDRIKVPMRTVSDVWNDGVYAIDRTYPLSLKWAETNNKGFLAKSKAKKEYMARILPALKDPGTKFEDLSLTAGTVSAISSDVMGLGSMVESLRSAERPCTECISRLEAMERAVADCISSLSSYGFTSGEYRKATELAQSIGPVFNDLDSKTDDWNAALHHFSVCVKLSESARLSTPDDCIAFCNALSGHFDHISDWAEWNRKVTQLASMGLAEAVDIVASNMRESIITASVCRSVYRSLIETKRQSSDILRMFAASDFENLIAKFKRLDQSYLKLNRNLLKYSLYQKVPRDLEKSVNGSEAYILYKAINTNTRKSIRRLISEVPNILPRICPCFLMSPQSVAQYITPNYPMFDVVIFDESSQITTSKAVGALGRAGTAVIAGDNKQLPPTTFFQKKIEPGEDEDEDLGDAESFLDDCLGLHMPETYLEWHYRSRHESLIAFSNMMFYDNKMLTFPSPNDQEARVTLRFIQGTYEKGKRVNTAEAQAIVEEIRRRTMDGSQSIGVIAFSTTQQACIEDMVDDLCNSDPEFAEKYNTMKEETFIKNLETVQGDERDVILFSIGYGPGPDGTVFQNFGPINREGGGRRLNVAVSRARNEMVVFSSMKSSQVNISASSSSGIRCFREFLKFVENHGRFYGEQHSIAPEGVSSIVSDIAENLQQHGYRTHYNVGKSGYRVDIAVVDPDNPKEYILGILGDGDNYRCSDNTRDREYAREDVLRNLKWSVMHVWSMDWFFRKEEVIDRIIGELESIRKGEVRKTDEQPDDDSIGILADECSEFGIVAPAGRRITYLPPDIPRRDIDQWDAITKPSMIRSIGGDILSAESPINEEYFIRLYSKCIGIQRLTEKNRNQLAYALQKVFSPVSRYGFTTYWKGEPYELEHYRVSDNPEDNRPIECIPLEELLLVCTEIVEKSISIPKDLIVSAMAKELGYRRAGDVIKGILEDVVTAAVKENIIAESDGAYKLA